MARLVKFEISAEEAARIGESDSDTEFADGFSAVTVIEREDGSLTVYAQQRPGDE